MIKTKRLFLFVLIITIFFFLSTYSLFLYGIFSTSQFISILIALIITTLNFIAGFLSAKNSLKKNEKTFIKIVFSSMVIRLFAMLLFILICLVFLDISRNSFIFSIFIFYIFYLIIEVVYLNFIKN